MPDESPISEIPLPAPTPLEQAALDWFARCNRGLSPEEEAQFEEWLVADRAHADLFNELSGTWQMLGQAAPATAEATPAPAPAAPSRLRWRQWVLPLAAAAAVALAYVGYWRPAHYSGAATTEVGALGTLQLPDGSVVKLSSDTELDIGFTPEARQVALRRGEASFAVAKNPARPFIVTANGVAVRAVGTAFNVRLSPLSVEVLVLEGRVKVNDALSGQSLLATAPGANAADTVLTPGERAVIGVAPAVQPRPAPAEVTQLAATEVQRRNAWQDRRLEFESAPLREIVEEFNRFNRHKLVIADPALAEQRFGGSFHADDADGLVRMLRENFGVTAEQFDDVTVLRAAK
ncbi:MAG: FecR family protein [Opitutales bacterium]